MANNSSWIKSLCYRGLCYLLLHSGLWCKVETYFKHIGFIFALVGTNSTRDKSFYFEYEIELFFLKAETATLGEEESILDLLWVLSKFIEQEWRVNIGLFVIYNII